jgi:hypothetical protein
MESGCDGSRGGEGVEFEEEWPVVGTVNREVLNISAAGCSGSKRNASIVAGQAYRRGAICRPNRTVRDFWGGTLES